MNALTIGLALLVVGCGALENTAPMLDQAMERAARVGGCIKLVCAIPLDDCRLRPGSCQQ